MKKIILLSLVFLGLSAFASDKIPVTLSRVYDGDTIEVINENNQKENIRLVGIDCYETSTNNRAYKQAYQNKITIEQVVAKGTKEKLALVEVFKKNPNKQLYVERQGKDSYNRTLGIIYLGKINVNKYMLKTGNALEYKYIRQ